MEHMENVKEIQVGTCTGNFPRIRVAGIKPSIPFSKGDKLVFKPTTDDKHGRQPVEVTIKSLEVNHHQVDQVEKGQLCGVELNCSRNQLPRQGDAVFRILS